MAADRFEVFNSYAFGVLMLILSTVTTYFIVMNFLMAVISSVLNVLGGIYTYRTCLNIYNRFKLIGGSESKLPFSHKDDRHELDSGSEDEFEDIDDNRTRLVGPVRKNSGGMLGKFFSFGGRRKRNSLKKDKHASGNDMDGFERVSRVNNKVRAKGFMSMRKDDRSKWKRYYFVMVRSNMYYYKSQSDWELSRTNSVKSRPIDLEGYIVSGVSVEPPYQIVISPAAEDDNRKIWEFRCDTVHEMDAWIQGFNLSSRVQAVPGPTNIEDMDLFDPTGVDGNYDKTNDDVWTDRNEESSEPATWDRGTVGSSSSVNSFYDVNTENSVTSFRSFNQ